MKSSVDEVSFLKSLRAGEETAFILLVDQYHTSLVRLARMFIRDEATAEELAQETWLAVLQGSDQFEGRSTLKTWLFSILTNKAKTRSQREKRSLTFSDLEDSASDSPTVDPARFNDPFAEKWADHWASRAGPVSWDGIPEENLISQETMKLIGQAIDALPENQRVIVTLRDMHELSSDEVCNVLGISEANQRVLLHRARAKIRQTLEDYLKPEH